jgi:histidine ammonia-lyase
MLELDGHRLTLEGIEAVAQGAPVEISAEARACVVRAREFVDRQFASGEAIYGVTTGFGRLASISIDPADALELQLNLVRSHAAGTGEPLQIPLVRAAGVLRANSLSATRESNRRRSTSSSPCSIAGSRRWCRARGPSAPAVTSRR